MPRKKTDQPFSLLDLIEAPGANSQSAGAETDTAQTGANSRLSSQALTPCLSASSKKAAITAAETTEATTVDAKVDATAVDAKVGEVALSASLDESAVPWNIQENTQALGNRNHKADNTMTQSAIQYTIAQGALENTSQLSSATGTGAGTESSAGARTVSGYTGSRRKGAAGTMETSGTVGTVGTVKKRGKVELPPFDYPMDPIDFVVCGIDEAGRGPLMGDVVAACVILDHRHMIPGIDDSKHLTEKKRDALAPLIKEYALAYGIGRASPQEIDELNILHATYLAMRRAYAAMQVNCDLALIDGNRIPPGLNIACQAVVKGDARVKEIGAASILAKTTRDADLYALDQQYPEYQFANHKGYPTAAHMSVLEKLPILPCYRFTYGPVKKLIQERNLQILPDHTLAPL